MNAPTAESKCSIKTIIRIEPQKDRNRKEIFTRLKIGVSIVIGFFAGKFAARYFGHHASEFFIAFFGFGLVFTDALFWAIDVVRQRAHIRDAKGNKDGWFRCRR